MRFDGCVGEVDGVLVGSVVGCVVGCVVGWLLCRQVRVKVELGGVVRKMEGFERKS